MPQISNNIIVNLIHTLKQRFAYVLLDLPHIWSETTASIIKEADHNLLVAQLWLKSATHSARLLDALQNTGVSQTKSSVVINRSGSKFKEAITPADFAMACKKKVNYYISNDSKTITSAENQGKAAVEISSSILTRQFMEIANGLVALNVNKTTD
jgi:pilus assembly protein CpaE